MTKSDITLVTFSGGPHAKLLFSEIKCKCITSPIYNSDVAVGYGLDNRETAAYIQADAGNFFFCSEWLQWLWIPVSFLDNGHRVSDSKAAEAWNWLIAICCRG